MEKINKELQWLYEKKEYMEAKLKFTASHLEKIKAKIVKLEKKEKEKEGS